MVLTMTRQKELIFVSHAQKESTTEVVFRLVEANTSEEPLGLVHTDVCGKMNV